MRAGAGSARLGAMDATVDLYWIPLGAGGHCVRFNGLVYEAIKAVGAHRQRCDLYHSALVVQLRGERYTIEVAPSPDGDAASRGVVGTGAVGSRRLGPLRLFRYEVRCWRGGSIPDLCYAVDARRLTGDPSVARRLLDLVAAVPRPVWGRDELRAGEMWNSNSVIAWLLATAGLPADRIPLPECGRAPGWDAGLVVAGRVLLGAVGGPDRQRNRAGDEQATEEHEAGRVVCLPQHDGGDTDRGGGDAEGDVARLPHRQLEQYTGSSQERLRRTRSRTHPSSLHP